MTDKVQKIREAVEKMKSNLIYGACSSQVAMETRCKEEAYNEVLAILDTMQEEPTIQKIVDEHFWEMLDEEPVSKDYRERYKKIAQSDAFQRAYANKSLGEVMSVEGEEPISGLDNGDMPVERWKQAVEAASNQRNYRSSKGLTETRDDYFVDGVQWADKHPKEESASEELGDYINKLSKQFPEVSFAKLSRIAVRVAKWQKKQDKETIEVAEDHAMLAGMEKMKEEMMKDAVGGYVIKDIEEGNGDFLLSADYLPKSMGLKDQQRVKVIVIKED